MRARRVVCDDRTPRLRDFRRGRHRRIVAAHVSPVGRRSRRRVSMTATGSCRPAAAGLVDANVSEDIRELDDQLAAVESDAKALVSGLSEERGTGRVEAGSWSVAECLDHLATG